MTVHYALIKNDMVQDVLVFEAMNEDLAEQVRIEHNADAIICTGDNNPSKYSSYINGEFIAPTYEKLVELGLITITE